MFVIKFGGSSVANAVNIQKVEKIIFEYLQSGDRLVVVFSALQGVTDLLYQISHLASEQNLTYQKQFNQLSGRHIEIIETLFENSNSTKLLEEIQEELIGLESILKGIYYLGELSPRSLDHILGFGERLSTRIISGYFENIGLRNVLVDTRNYILTDDQFGSAKVDFEQTYRNIDQLSLEKANESGLWLLTGFIASSREGHYTTLGRGGSDYTASIFGAGLDAEEIHIWTDVDGVLTADPRKVSKSFSISELSYEEAIEMSNLGAKVLYPPTVLPAYQKQIPIRIKNTFNPLFEGTFIGNPETGGNFLVKGVTSLTGISLITLNGNGISSVQDLSSRLFRRLSKSSISVILIMQGSAEHSITFAIQDWFNAAAKKVIHDEFAMEIQNNLIDPLGEQISLCLISVIGENMRHMPGIAGRFLLALGRNGINARAITQGASELSISVAISEFDQAKALNSTHEIFFLSDTKTLNLFLIGTGNIGGTLLQMMEHQFKYLQVNKSVEINLVGIANSKKMYFNGDTNLLGKGKGWLETNGEPMISDHFIDKMLQMNLPNSIFIDCTADLELPNYYEKILNSSISIVTPNKAANSESFHRYSQIKHAQKLRGASFCYETNVGAGLPIINTLNDLLESGDKILKIEAVLSGSLSFIFNKLNEGSLFSEVVREAIEKGFTEPDPRIDLSGKDFARKLVILSREIGIPMELKDVTVGAILPDTYFNDSSVEEFLKAIQNEDERFKQMVKSAKTENKVLRYIGNIQGNKASIVLHVVNQEHPFYNLSGSDNIISFTSIRYRERPLVVKGPGAGAEVTAAGVFSEIISISSQGKLWGKL